MAPPPGNDVIRVRAPAKLNLYLRVLGRRPDGYHELETIFERVDLADELTFEPISDAVLLTCSDPTLSCGEDNLVMRAARLLQQHAGVRTGARIHLTKRIPIAAGLGGGSSDGAAALRGLNTLWKLALPAETLQRLGVTLGADVPFFLTDSAFAIGRGRGDVCEPLVCGTRLAHVLVVPDARLSTGEVFASASFNLTASKPGRTIVAHALRNGPALAGLAEGLWNDLEPEAIRRCPAIARIQLRLHDIGCLGSRLSGSGPAVFGLCRDLADASAIAARLRKDSPAAWRIEVVQTDTHAGVVAPIGQPA